MTKNIEDTIWYRKLSMVVFTLFFILFATCSAYFEIAGEMNFEGRIVLYAVLLLIVYGWIRSIRRLRTALGDKKEEVTCPLTAGLER